MADLLAHALSEVLLAGDSTGDIPGLHHTGGQERKTVAAGPPSTLAGGETAAG